jgi:hypothetical protein
MYGEDFMRVLTPVALSGLLVLLLAGGCGSPTTIPTDAKAPGSPLPAPKPPPVTRPSPP